MPQIKTESILSQKIRHKNDKEHPVNFQIKTPSAQLGYTLKTEILLINPIKTKKMIK